MLIGGSPLRVLRLGPGGAALLDRWAAGVPVGDGRGEARLAGRLVDAGFAHPRPPDRWAATVTIVIPVRDNVDGLVRTLGALDPTVPVVVVDDGSVAAGQVAATVAVHRSGPTCRVIRHGAARGPAAARNSGWRAATTEVVAFVDADCVPEASWLDRLLPHLADPAVAAVAPRITSARSTEDRRRIAAYEAVASPLDLGTVPAPVRPGSRVPYVPTAALVVRRADLESAGGFDESLRYGEDVDLVWRLSTGGRRVRYEPAARVAHPARPSSASWLAQRVGYGRSAAPLAERHGDAVAPLDLSGWSMAAWALAAAGQPTAGLAVAGASVVAVVRRLHRSSTVPLPAVVVLAARGQLRAGLALAGAVRRAWWPAAVVVGVGVPAARRPLLAAAVVPGVVSWHRRRPALDPVSWLALNLLDDLAYGAGVWTGVWTARSVRALLPRRH